MKTFQKTLLLSLLAVGAAFAQISGAGQIGCTASPVTGTGWTTSTSVNTTQVLAGNVAGAQVLVTIDQGTTLTVGAIQFQGDAGDGTFINLASWQIVDPTTPPFAVISQPYTLQASTNKQFLIYMAGMNRLQLKLTTAITGSATVTPYTTLVCYQLPAQTFQATAANLNATAVGAGTAGSPSGGVLSVQGVTSGQAVPISGAVSQSGNWTARVVGNTGATVDAAPGGTAPTNALAAAGVYNSSAPSPSTGQLEPLQLDSSANLNVNLKTAVPAGTNLMGKVGIDQTTVGTTNGVSLAQIGASTVSTAATGVQKVGVVGNAGGAVDQAVGSAIPANAVMAGFSDGTNTQFQYLDPCQRGAKTYLPISEATSSLTTIITGTASKHTYFCSIFLISATAQNINLISATGTNCGTTVHGSVLGTNTSSAAAANGPNLSANNGFTLGNGAAAVASDNTAADNICYSSSGTGQVSGVISYVQY